MNKRIKISGNSILFFLSIIPITFLVISFFMMDTRELIRGFIEIIVHPDVLLVDLLQIGGLYPGLLNVALTSLFCLALVYILGSEITGPVIAALLTVFSFSFMGKNLYNILPILFGGYIYSHFAERELKDMMAQLLFATTLGPIVTKITFATNLTPSFALILGFIAGCLIPMLVIPVSNQLIKAHMRFNIYNVGFAGGIIGTVVASVLKGFKVSFETQTVLSRVYGDILFKGSLVIFTYFLILGFILNDFSFKGYKATINSGRNYTTFIEDHGYGLGFISMAILGFISLAYVLLNKGHFDGPTISGVFTVVAFAVFGKNPKNIIPIMIGVSLCSLLPGFENQTTLVIIAGLFGTTLAPIAGYFGFIPGVIAGILHLAVVNNTSYLHGGLHLYNNGFSGGLVSMFLVPILDKYYKKVDDL